jgi:peptidoglycan LD-endopeptidase CwlK
MPSFSQRSKDRLATCHPDLIKLFNAVVKKHDCTILEGVRSDARQRELFAAGKSKLDGSPGHRSKHQPTIEGWSRAVDVAPYPIDWKDRERFIHFAGIVLGYAESMGIDLRIGADWSGDGIFTESFFDAPHVELR